MRRRRDLCSLSGLSALTMLVALAPGCRHDICTEDVDVVAGLLRSVAVTEPLRQGGRVVLEVPGRVFVHHGFACGQARTPSPVRLRGALRLPQGTPPYTHAVVFLNGWKVSFLDEESEMLGFGAAIANVERNGTDLTWEGGGGISGEDDGDRIEVCYWHTTVAWTSYFQDLAVVEEDPEQPPRRVWQSGEDTALLRMPRFVQDPSLEPASWAGVLPMGFAMWWPDCDEDYLLQAACHLGPSEPWVYGDVRHGSGAYRPTPSLPPATATGVVDDFYDQGFVSWESRAIFKNGDAADSFRYADKVAALAGSTLSMVEPHFGITPVFQQQGGSYGPTAKEVSVEKLPFHLAVPVLKGWNLYNHIDDEQVRTLGIWIESFDYTRTPGSTGTLTYKVDYEITSDERVGHTGNPGVAILGIDDVYPD